MIRPVRPGPIIKAFFPDVVWRMDPNRRELFLTFDDGPNPETTPAILDILDAEKVSATFFCIGRNCEKHPQLFQRILESGHGVGNHTYDHLNGWKTDKETYLKDVQKAAEIIPGNLFRPPYGRISPGQARALKKNFSIVMWDVLSWDFDRILSPATCIRKTLGNIRAGSIITLHDSSKAKERTLPLLKAIIAFAGEKGYSFQKL
jgi:peptidoglycan-N-acetylglucosamine deacetylase